MTSDGIWQLCDRLRAERLQIASEISSLKDLHCEVKKKQIELLQLSWNSHQHTLTSHRLLSSHRLVSPENACAIVSHLDACEPVEAYKRLGHHFSTVTRLLRLLFTHPQAVAEILNVTDGIPNAVTEDVVHCLFSVVFGNGTYPTDEQRLLEVLAHLIKAQLVTANNPRLILRKGTAAFPRLYKLFSESLFSVKIFLTSALHDSVMHVLCQDEIFLDIDPAKSPLRFPAAERNRRFGDQTNPQYHKRLLAHRKVIVEKLVLLAHGFIKGICDSLCCFPESLVWLVQQMHRNLVENQRMSENEATLICTDLIVTNLLCPAITNPETVGVISDTPISHIARFNLMQIGQIIQTLALSRLEAPPPHFQLFISQFNDSPICSIIGTLLSRDCPDIGNLYPVILNDASTSGEEMLKRNHFLGSVWEINTLLSIIQSGVLNSLSSASLREELQAISARCPQQFSSTLPEISSDPMAPRQSRLKNLADRVQNSLSQSPTRTASPNRSPSTANSSIPLECFDILIFEDSDDGDLVGLVPVDSFMDQENRSNKKRIKEGGKKRARFVEDDSIVGSAVSDITADNASDLEEEAAAQDEVGSVSSSQEAPQEDRLLLLDEDAESTLPDNVSDVGGISGRGSPSLSGRDTPLSQGPRDGPDQDNIAVSLVSGGEPGDVAQRHLPAVPMAIKKQNAEGLEEKFGKFTVPNSGHLGSCRDDQRSLLSDTWSTNVVASDDEGGTSVRAILAQLPVENYGNRSLRPINRTGSVNGVGEDRSDTWSLDAVASDSEVDGREKTSGSIQGDIPLPPIVPVAPLIDVSLPPPPTENELGRRRSSGSSFSYARSEADSELSRPSDIPKSGNILPPRPPISQSGSEGLPSASEDAPPPHTEDVSPSTSGTSGGEKKRSGIFMGLQRVGDKVRKGISSTPLRQLPQSSTISDFFGEFRDKKRSNLSESQSENRLSELDGRSADDILAKYQRAIPTNSQDEMRSNMSPPLEMAPSLMVPVEEAAPYYEVDNVLGCRAFLDAKRKLRQVLSSVGSLSMNRIADEEGMRGRPERDQLGVVLRTLLAEAVNSRQQVLSAQVREVLRCLLVFDNKGIHMLMRTLRDELRQRSCYICYLQQSRLVLLRFLSYIDQLTFQVAREKTLTEECIVDILVRFYLENRENHLRRFIQEFSQLHAQDEKIECLNRALSSLFSRLPTALMWRDAPNGVKEYVKKALERVVMSQIHGIAFYPNQEGDRHRDEVLYRALAKLGRIITPDHPMLRIPKVLHGEAPWPSAQAEISILNAYKSARDKLACIVRCCETISNLVTMAGIGAAAADDVTPVLVYVLIQANPPALLSNVQYIQSFGGSLLSGAEGYWWTQFVSAIEFVKTLL